MHLLDPALFDTSHPAIPQKRYSAVVPPAIRLRATVRLSHKKLGFVAALMLFNFCDFLLCNGGSVFPITSFYSQGALIEYWSCPKTQRRSDKDHSIGVYDRIPFKACIGLKASFR